MTQSSLLRKHAGTIAFFVIVVVCFAIFINRDSIFSGPSAAGPSADGVVGPSITFGDVDLILNPDSDGGVEAYQVEYAGDTGKNLGRNIDIGLKWTNGIGFTDVVTKITIERAFGDGTTNIIDLDDGIGTKDGELVNIIIKGEDIPDGQNVVGTNTFKVNYHTSGTSDDGKLLGTASVEILDSHLDKTLTISEVTTLSFDPNVKEEIVASLDNVEFTRYDLTLKNFALGSYFKSIRIEDSDEDGVYKFKTLKGETLRFLEDKLPKKHKLKKYNDYYLISPILDPEEDVFYSKNVIGAANPLKIVKREDVTTSGELADILFTITKSVGPPPLLETYTKLPTGNTWKANDKYRSPNNAFEIIQRDDGNLVIHKGNPLSPSWEGGTAGQPRVRAKFWDGHLFMVDTVSETSVKTIKHVTGPKSSEYFLALGNDGSLTMRDKIAKVLVEISPPTYGRVYSTPEPSSSSGLTAEERGVGPGYYVG